MGRKLLIHSIVFSPDGVSTAYLYNDIALRFKEEGYEVVVLTTTPQYNIVESELQKQPLRKKCLGLYYESTFNGIKIIHVTQKKFKSSVLRILGFIYWHIMSFFLGLREKKVDVILSPSPPLTIGLINLFLGKLKKTKVIYNVQEIYPDLLINSKGLKSNFVIKILKKLERYVYNESDAVTTIDEIFANTIIGRFEDKTKLKIIPNFVDTDIYKAIPQEEINVDRDLFPQSSALKLMYAGNVGLAQDWVPLIELAKRLKDENIEFFVIGEGVMKAYLEKEIKENDLKKVFLLPYQPRHTMPSLLAYSDMQFIFMVPETANDGFPSKVYTIMACEKPLLICSKEKTPIINFLKDKDCAYLITENDLMEKVDELVGILKEKSTEEFKRKGQNGLEIIKSQYSKSVVTKQYVDLVDSLLN